MRECEKTHDDAMRETPVEPLHSIGTPASLFLFSCSYHPDACRRGADAGKGATESPGARRGVRTSRSIFFSFFLILTLSVPFPDLFYAQDRQRRRAHTALAR